MNGSKRTEHTPIAAYGCVVYFTGMTFSELLGKAEISPREFAEETGFDYRSVVRWCKSAPPPALRDELNAILWRYIRREERLPQIVGIRRAPKTGRPINSVARDDKYTHMRFRARAASSQPMRTHRVADGTIFDIRLTKDGRAFEQVTDADGNTEERPIRIGFNRNGKTLFGWT
jgi:hypothetical protein